MTLCWQKADLIYLRGEVSARCCTLPAEILDKESQRCPGLGRWAWTCSNAECPRASHLTQSSCLILLPPASAAPGASQDPRAIGRAGAAGRGYARADAGARPHRGGPVQSCSLGGSALLTSPLPRGSLPGLPILPATALHPQLAWPWQRQRQQRPLRPQPQECAPASDVVVFLPGSITGA